MSEKKMKKGGYRDEPEPGAIVEVERAVCGSLLMDPPLIAPICERMRVSAEWFTYPQWRDIFAAAMGCWKDGGAADSVLVLERLKGNRLDEIQQAIEMTPTAAHGEYYLALLQDNFSRREIMKLTGKANGALTDSAPAAVLKLLQDGVAEIQEGREGCGGLVPVDGITDNIMDDFRLIREEHIVKKNRRFVMGVRMPWDVLNALYAGLKPGLHIIAARPSQGKTALAVNLSMFWAKEGIRHLFVGLDMKAKELLKRYGCSVGRVSLPKISFGGGHDDLKRFEEGLVSITKTKMLEITESPFFEHIRSEAYAAVTRRGCRVVMIDYLQLVTGVGTGREANWERIGKVTMALKQLALELDVPIVLLTQLSRDSAKENRRPELHDLGDSGEIERAAASVLMLWRDDEVAARWAVNPPLDIAYGETYLAKKVRPIWLILAKNQQGPTGELPFVMYPHYFMLRPGDHEAEPQMKTDEKTQKTKIVSWEPCFRCIRDDFRILEEDKKLAAAGVLGQRGIDFGEAH